MVDSLRLALTPLTEEEEMLLIVEVTSSAAR
jgi:hypothetical protein